MSGQYWVSPAPPFHVADASALTASGTLTEFSPVPQIQLPGGLLGEYAGKRIEVQAWGVYTTTGTQGTITLGLYSGTIGQAIGSAVAMAVSPAVTWVASQTNRVWRIEGNASIRSVGSSGTGIAVLECSNFSSATCDMAATTAGSTFTIDTTVTRYLSLGATLSVASQSITCRYFGVRLVN